MAFRACRVFAHAASFEARVTPMEIDELSPGDVVVRVAYSSLNYKDARAVTGRGRPIMRRTPLNAGIDLSGVVESSADPRFPPGMPVIANGMGLGEAHDGGFAEYARLPADWLMPLPGALTLRSAMAFGTAGYTAALCVHRMEGNGQRPEMGPVVVTGATGGVGSIAVRLLAARGYQVIAVSGRPEHHGWLRELGASDVRTVEELELGDKPLERTRFGGAIDNVGGTLLAQLLPHIVEWGNVASVGLAGGAEFATLGLPVHPARRQPAGRELGQQPDAVAARDLGTAGRRSQHRRHRALRDEGDWAGRGRADGDRVARPAACGACRRETAGVALACGVRGSGLPEGLLFPK